MSECDKMKMGRVYRRNRDDKYTLECKFMISRLAKTMEESHFPNVSTREVVNLLSRVRRSVGCSMQVNI